MTVDTEMRMPVIYTAEIDLILEKYGYLVIRIYYLRRNYVLICESADNSLYILALIQNLYYL